MKRPADSAQRRRQMRNQGYADGFRGRPARHVDAEYQQGWRRGREARAKMQTGTAA